MSKNLIFKRKKNGGISKIEEALVLKDTFSETKYLCVLTYQISNYYHNSSKFSQGGENFTHCPIPPQKTQFSNGKRHNDAVGEEEMGVRRGGALGAFTNDILKFTKIIEFQIS